MDSLSQKTAVRETVQIPVPFPPGSIRLRMVIGKEGNILKSIARETDLELIKYNEELHCIELYGRSDNIPNALSQLKEQIESIQKIKDYEPDEFGYFPIPFSPRSIGLGMLIGKKGEIFKEIAKKTGVDSIFYDEVVNAIEIRGPATKIRYAKGHLKKEIERVQNYLANQNEPREIVCIPMPFPSNSSGIPMLIGKKGVVFNNIMRKSYVDSIIYKKNQNIIEIKGPAKNIPDALSRLNNHIKNVKNWIETKNLTSKS